MHGRWMRGAGPARPSCFGTVSTLILSCIVEGGIVFNPRCVSSLFSLIFPRDSSSLSHSSSPRSRSPCSQLPRPSLCGTAVHTVPLILSFPLLPVLDDTTTFAVTLLATVLRPGGSRGGSAPDKARLDDSVTFSPRGEGTRGCFEKRRLPSLRAKIRARAPCDHVRVRVIYACGFAIHL